MRKKLRLSLQNVARGYALQQDEVQSGMTLESWMIAIRLFYKDELKENKDCPLIMWTQEVPY